MATVQMKDLLEAGVHFGHQTHRWNPAMKKYIFMQRHGIHVIDLNKTLQLLNSAASAITEIAAAGKPILFVGTKKQAQSTIREQAERTDQFHVSNRWLGGMLTNFQTIQRSIKQLDDLDRMAEDGTYSLLNKKEVAGLERSRSKLEFNLGGIRKMRRTPGAVIIVDTNREDIAIAEATKLSIPIFAIVDTNCDPNEVDYPIPANDDAMRSIRVIINALGDAMLEGAQQSANRAKEKEEAAKAQASSGEADPKEVAASPKAEGKSDDKEG